jgi:hypothetical protein
MLARASPSAGPVLCTRTLSAIWTVAAQVILSATTTIASAPTISLNELPMSVST